jgi:hypothetical protein
LQIENEQLRAEQVRLKVEEARIGSAERLQGWADAQNFITPASDRTIYLEPKNQKSFALNRQ